MPPLSLFSIEIVGSWSDAWLYKDHLILWSRANEMYQVTLGGVTRHVEEEYGGQAATLAEYLLFRNDWKNSSAFRSLRRLPQMAREFEIALSEITAPLKIVADKLPIDEIHTEPASGILLDTAIYANRVYSASTDGLFESRVKLRYPGHPHGQRQLLDRRVSCVSVKYAAVNASAGDEGLWFHPIEWGYEGEPDFEYLLDEDDPFNAYGREREERISKIADISSKNSFSSRHLLNYTDDRVPDFIPAVANRERPHSGASFEDWRILGFGEPIDISMEIQNALGIGGSAIGRRKRGAEGKEGEEGLAILGNSNYRLLVEWQNQLRVLDLDSSHLDQDDDRRHPKVRMDKAFTQLTDDLVSREDALETYAFGTGFLVELYDEVRLLTRFGSQRFFEGEVANVRTFRDSKRYQEVSAIVHEDGVRIGGYFSWS